MEKKLKNKLFFLFFLVAASYSNAKDNNMYKKFFPAVVKNVNPDLSLSIEFTDSVPPACSKIDLSEFCGISALPEYKQEAANCLKNFADKQIFFIFDPKTPVRFNNKINGFILFREKEEIQNLNFYLLAKGIYEIDYDKPINPAITFLYEQLIVERDLNAYNKKNIVNN